jgi:hypothetical protein
VERRPVRFERKCVMSPEAMTCVHRLRPLPGETTGIFSMACCGAGHYCPLCHADVVMMPGDVGGLPILAAGIAPDRGRQYERYIKAAGQYDVLPAIEVGELGIAWKFALQYQRSGVPWVLVQRGEMLALFKRRAGGIGCGGTGPAFAPVVVRRESDAAKPFSSSKRKRASL